MRKRNHKYKIRRIIRRTLRAERIMRDVESLSQEPYLWTSYNTAYKRWVGLRKLCFLHNIRF